MIKERFTAPPFAFKASSFAEASEDMTEGKQGLRIRVKQKIEIQKPHFSK
jgi:hypothetical protein